MKGRNPSILSRLLLGTGLAILLMVLLGIFIVYFSVRKSFSDQIDTDLKNTANLMVSELETQRGLVYHEWLLDIEDDPTRAVDELAQAWDLRTGQSVKSPALGPRELPKFHGTLNEPVFLDAVIGGDQSVRAIGMKVNAVPKDREQIVPEYKIPQFVFVLARSTRAKDQALRNLRQTLNLVGLGTFLLCGIAIYKVISQSLVPLKTLSDRLAEREDTHLGRPINIADDFPQELRGLVEGYNILLERIEGVRKRERDFSHHAAHELRTPLAGIQAVVELAMTRERTGEDYRTRLAKIENITSGMKITVTRLMDFARLQGGNEVLLLERVDFHELLGTAWKELSQKTTARKLRVDWQLKSEHFIQENDEELVRIMMSNLIDNAASYTAENSAITIRTEDHDRHFVLTVSNSLPDKLDEDHERLFEPFYRADKVRTNAEGHSGIGLSLCREIALTIGATIEIAPSDEKTFEAKVRIPFSD
ncbi:ATP-binding protein [Akkermansiaceae bacterium]|nr:ATP-binding protein [Akkermansiaceae bacterium]